MKKTY